MGKESEWGKAAGLDGVVVKMLKYCGVYGNGGLEGRIYHR